jgi:hypothetical protein
MMGVGVVVAVPVGLEVGVAVLWGGEVAAGTVGVTFTTIRGVVVAVGVKVDAGMGVTVGCVSATSCQKRMSKTKPR